MPSLLSNAFGGSSFAGEPGKPPAVIVPSSVPFSSASVRSNPIGPPGSSVPLGTLGSVSSPKSNPTPTPPPLDGHAESLNAVVVQAGATPAAGASSAPLVGTKAVVGLRRADQRY